MISLFSKPKVVAKEGNKAVFEIESLYPGYGVTVANSLRRVLLSSLEGAAISKMKISGNGQLVPHEFSTIRGAHEDVIQIMLNLKKLRFKMFSDEPQKAFLKVKGEKEVKGSDFQLPSQLELVNPDERVALMTDKKTELEIEIEVEKGVGYLSREARKRTQKLAIGEILLDAIFSPVKKVGYQIENMRVGERTDFDKVVLSVETDGTLSPERALVDAAKILVDQFSVVANSFSEEELVQTPRPFKKPKREKKPAAKKAVKKTKKKR